MPQGGTLRDLGLFDFMTWDHVSNVASPQLIDTTRTTTRGITILQILLSCVAGVICWPMVDSTDS
jgi:hypothetical protein